MSENAVVQRFDLGAEKVKCFCVVQEDDETSDVLEDRRDLLFAMIGIMWVVGTLREVLLGGPSSAYAKYQDDVSRYHAGNVRSKHKTTLIRSICVECLLYQEEEENLLYFGADTKVLLERIQ